MQDLQAQVVAADQALHDLWGWQQYRITQLQEELRIQGQVQDLHTQLPALRSETRFAPLLAISIALVMSEFESEHIRKS